MPVYRIVEVPADGACLFHCLALANKSTDAADCKHWIADYIQEHADDAMNRSTITYRVAISSEFGWPEDEAPVTYASEIERADTWGGAIDISAFADASRRLVRVYARDGGDGLRVLQDFWPVKVRLRAVRLLYENDHYSLMQLANASESSANA